MKNSAKIHFINRIDKENAGDWSCCPLPYYYDYFKQFSLMRHDIDFINFNEIGKNDVVILGGSGLINVTVSFNEAINKILNLCDCTVMWGGGFNTHDQQWFQGDEFPEINFSLFSLIGIRDYNHPSGIEYLPCPSILAFPDPGIDKIKIMKKYGVIEHKDLPIKAFLAEDKITNNSSIENIYEFIRSHEAIITNSYHCAYWTLALGRKAIVVNKFSTKFDFFKYKPEFVNISEDDSMEVMQLKMERAFASASVYNNFYEEAVQQNHNFFEKVKILVENKQIPRDKDYQNLYQMNIQQLWNMQSEPEKIRREFYENMYRQFEKNNGEIYKRHNQLHSEVYAILNQYHEELWEQLNSLHDEVYELLRCLHDEMYEQLHCLHDEMYEQINCLHDDVYGEVGRMRERMAQNQTCLEEEMKKSFFKRLCFLFKGGGRGI